MSTIGVAITVPPPWGDELQGYRRSCGDEAAGAIPTHVTLVPPTVVNDDAMDDVDHHLAQVGACFDAFPLRLRGTATFQPVSPVVFVCVTEGISTCELLAERARSGPLRQDLSFPYHPHVTIAHDVGDESLEKAYEAMRDYDATFDVDAFSLYLHGSDGVWRPQRRYLLGG